MKAKQRIAARWIAFGVMLALTPIAWGHSAHGHPGFSGGFTHPYTGLDHLLAMIAVGMWAVRMGGGAVWRLPLTFAGVMVLGGFVAQVGMPLPAIESGIAASVLVLGLSLATWKQPPVWAAVALVGFFAVFHGYAHIAEHGFGQQTGAYIVGFVLATIVLHALGIAFGIGVRRTRTIDVLSWTGAGVAMLGLGFCFGIL